MKTLEDELSNAILGAAIEVHRVLGEVCATGYEEALKYELEDGIHRVVWRLC